ncbi:hypothetical protein BDU57DRAFT_520013 [Ampelomyces quisqualis]|uniref:Heterokaryon incompatibility domain-containing protein n=1 Tax=Ampelomyces quisqualis TaxID=50730 RepID=A0A6A5QGW1_AMPQU|nr:hypothetical protein BDU57DRAFT_520013 [Ampelomyces quisqualis]
MRLIERKDNGVCSLVKFNRQEIPPYAILSHTWGTDDEELTFQELQANTPGIQEKRGYAKLDFCATQASRDNLRYFWLDTCCIDKSNSAELAEAIVSMYSWYRNATTCYVYLPDFSIKSNEGGLPVDALRRCRWFSRGWTLQELIAPTKVEFFSKEGHRLGDRSLMAQHLQQVTGIRAEILRGDLALDGVSIEERMSWLRNRETKIEEDAAYCMQGIFGVNMLPMYGETKESAFSRLENKIRKRAGHSKSFATLDGRLSKSSCKPFSTIPFAPDPDFVDRPDIIDWLGNKLARSGGRAALVGLGGVGKSQLAIQYAHGELTSRPGTFTFWVHASSQTRFEAAYRAFADKLDLPGRHDPKTNILKLVYDWLCDEANGFWLMVLDNVDDVDTFFAGSQHRQGNKASDDQLPLLASFLPQSRNGSILVTSRSKEAAARLVGGYNHIKEVRSMDTNQGLRLLHNKLSNAPDEQDAISLLAALDHMPLVISQAAAYINRRPHMNIADYLAKFRANSENKAFLLNWESDDLRRDASMSNSIVTTWQMSFESLREERPSAAELLSFMSCFSSQAIPKAVLRRHRKLHTESNEQENDERFFENDLDLLLSYSLVTATATDTCDMHPLVHFCTQLWVSKAGQKEHYDSKFVYLMAETFPNASYESFAQYEQLLPHVEGLINNTYADEATVQAWVHIITSMATFMWLRGDYGTGQAAAERILAVQEKMLGVDHEGTMKVLTILGLLMQGRGKYNEAEALHRRAMACRTRTLGQDHESTLISMGNLAWVLQDLGSYKESEALRRQALATYERIVGINHNRTLMGASNLAIGLQSLGKYEESEKYSRMALEGRIRNMGDQHPKTLLSLNNLGGVLHSQGKYGEAEVLYRKALAGRRTKLGQQHPMTLASLNNLASVLRDQERYGEAEPLARQVLEQWEKIDIHHPHTFTSMCNLSRVLEAKKEYREAETLGRRALEGREKVLGPQHTDTLISVNNLAGLLVEMGQYKEAAQLYERAAVGLEKDLGAEHPWTVSCRDNLDDARLQELKARRTSKNMFWRLKLRMGIRLKTHPV